MAKKAKTFTTTVKCNCSPDGKGCGMRNMSGHKEDCPAHKAFLKSREK